MNGFKSALTRCINAYARRYNIIRENEENLSDIAENINRPAPLNIPIMLLTIAINSDVILCSVIIGLAVDIKANPQVMLIKTINHISIKCGDFNKFLALKFVFVVVSLYQSGFFINK